MKRLMSDFRLIPIVLVAAAALFTLKVVGLLTQGGYTLGAGHLSKTDREAFEARNVVTNRNLAAAARRQEDAAQLNAQSKKKSWAQEMFFPDEVTGSVTGSSKPAAPAKEAPKEANAEKGDKKAPAKPAEPKPMPDGVAVQVDPKPLSASERALLERLSERRQELEQRARELDVRETLLREAEKRIETRTGELKDIESRISAASEKKEEADKARLKSLVTMYENMKAKEAARIFDRLDIKLATEVANLINPRRMSDIMAQMNPEAAERLTVELANRGAAADPAASATSQLPKIEGNPSGG
jgi:flagellar motility protein MotE (MotC chaperone)